MYPPGYTTGDDAMAPDNRGSCRSDKDDEEDMGMFTHDDDGDDCAPDTRGCSFTEEPEERGYFVEDPWEHSPARNSDPRPYPPPTSAKHARRIQIDVPGSVCIGNLAPGETFRFPNAVSASNVYMIVSHEQLDGRGWVNCVLLNKGVLYDSPPNKRVMQVDVSMRIAARKDIIRKHRP